MRLVPQTAQAQLEVATKAASGNANDSVQLQVKILVSSLAIVERIHVQCTKHPLECFSAFVDWLCA